jgi:hypothetical protein
MAKSGIKKDQISPNNFTISAKSILLFPLRSNKGMGSFAEIHSICSWTRDSSLPIIFPLQVFTRSVLFVSAERA